MTRRAFLASSAAAMAAPPAKRSSLGVATTCYMTVRKFKDTLEFLDHCEQLGAAGIQSALTSLEPAYLDKVKSRLAETGMYMEVMTPLPKLDMAPFIATVEGAKRVGALCLRSACLSGRRYENFSTLEEWQKFVKEAKAAVARAVPICEKQKMPLGIENHKDWTVDEMVAIQKSYSSEYFGVCLDLGNSISLLDDPMEVVERLAPYAVTTHIKDMGVAGYSDGFLLSEVILGQGMLKLSSMIATIKKARPKSKMTLEMITRDPLKVPAYTDKYWATFPDRSGVYLGRMMRMVKEHGSKLPMLSNLSPEKQRATEEDNVRRCLATFSA